MPSGVVASNPELSKSEVGEGVALGEATVEDGRSVEVGISVERLALELVTSVEDITVVAAFVVETGVDEDMLEEDRSIEVDVSVERLAVELNISVEDTTVVMASIVETEVGDAMLDVVDEVNGISGVDDAIMELELEDTACEEEDDSAAGVDIELELKAVEATVLEVVSLEAMTATEEDVDDAILELELDDGGCEEDEDGATNVVIELELEVVGITVLETVSLEVMTATEEEDSSLEDATLDIMFDELLELDTEDVVVGMTMSDDVGLELMTGVGLEATLDKEVLDKDRARDVVGDCEGMGRADDLALQSPKPGWQPRPQ
jgi:hypothetical protein